MHAELATKDLPKGIKHIRMCFRIQLPSSRFGRGKFQCLGCGDNVNLKCEALLKIGEKELTNGEMTMAFAQSGTFGLERIFLEFLNDWSRDWCDNNFINSITKKKTKPGVNGIC